jgi:hypothetical protein
MIENDSQLLFYKVLFSYFQKICSQTLIHILCMQASPPWYVQKFYLKNILYLKTCFITILKHCFEY